MSWYPLRRRSGYCPPRRTRSGPAAVIVAVLCVLFISGAAQTRPWVTGPTLAGLVGIGVLIVLVVLARRRLQVAHASTLAGYCTLPPELFEAAVAELLDRLGWSSMNVMASTQDLGVDVLARDPSGRLAAIRCKRWRPGSVVGPPVVQQLGGSVEIYRADRALVFTTASFSAQAIDLARRMDVELVDGRRLAHMAQQARRPAA